MLKKSVTPLMLLVLSTILTSVSMFILPFLLSLILPPSLFSFLEFQSWFLFGHLYFLYLITACLYWIVGCFIGIKAKGCKDAAIKAICVGFGLFFSLLIIGSLYYGTSIFAWMFQYLIFSLPGVAVVVLPAVLVCFLRTRVKLNQYVLFAISSAIIIITYFVISGVYTNAGENTPSLDYMSATPIYKGVKQQIVKDSQFQLERDQSTDEVNYLGFGSFPSIGYCDESAIMVAEFCHQHLNLEKNNEQYSIIDSVISYSIEMSVKWLVEKWVFHGYGYYSSRYDNFIGDRPMDIVILPGKPDESYQNNKGEIVEIISEPIALDALVFIVHKDNPVDSLSAEQLRDIYAGKIKNWQGLGGDNKAIKNYQRSKLSHTYRIMKEEVMQGTPLTTPVQAKDLSDLKEAAYQNYQESIGYCLLSFLESDGYRLDGEVKILSIDGIYPDEDSIRNGTYPYITTFYAAIRKGEENDNGGRFLEWILSDEGQACIRQSGYFPLH